MAAISSDGDLDLHSIRHGLKLKRDTGSTRLFENRNEYACPVCEQVFQTIFASEERHNRFNPENAQPFCVVREDDRILVFTHT